MPAEAVVLLLYVFAYTGVGIGPEDVEVGVGMCLEVHYFGEFSSIALSVFVFSF